MNSFSPVTPFRRGRQPLPHSHRVRITIEQKRRRRMPPCQDSLPSPSANADAAHSDLHWPESHIPMAQCLPKCLRPFGNKRNPNNRLDRFDAVFPWRHSLSIHPNRFMARAAGSSTIRTATNPCFFFRGECAVTVYRPRRQKRRAGYSKSLASWCRATQTDDLFARISHSRVRPGPALIRTETIPFYEPIIRHGRPLPSRTAVSGPAQRNRTA